MDDEQFKLLREELTALREEVGLLRERIEGMERLELGKRVKVLEDLVHATLEVRPTTDWCPAV